MFITLFLIFIILVLSAVLKLMTRPKITSDVEEVKQYPGPQQKFIIGNADIVQKYGGIGKSHRMFADLAIKYGPVYLFSIFGKTRVVISDPVLVKEIITDQTRFPDRFTGFTGFHSVLPHSLLGLHLDDEWHQHRNLLGPMFADRYMRSYYTTVVGQAEKLIDKWAAADEIELRQDMTAAAGDIIGLAGFGTDFKMLGDPNNDIQRHSINLLAEVQSRNFEPSFVRFLNYGRQKRFNDAYKRFEKLAAEVIDNYDPNSDQINFISVMVQAGMKREHIIHEAVALILAGRETTANTLSWLFYSLARNPDKLAILQQEVDSVLEDKDVPAYNEISKLKYTRMCINEALRLYPTVPAITRTCDVDTTVASYPVKKGQMMLLSFWAIGRNPLYYPDPEAFKPERFEAESSGIVPYSFQPFGNGPRGCIGRQFAIQEMIVLTASVVKNLSLKVSPKTPLNVGETVGVSLGMAGPVLMNFSRR